MIAPDALPWSDAAAPIWARVCGYESALRRRRALLMLTAHFDDSWNQDVFVVAGFLAPAENWAMFSDEWRLALSAPRGVRKLVANEAMKLRGEFHGFSAEDRDRKLQLLTAIINQYVSLEVFSIIPIQLFTKEFERSGLPKISGDPYYPAMFTVIRGLAQRQIALGMIEKIDFIFDEKKKQQARILEAWSGIAEQQLPEMQQIISKTPVFDSDENVLPLQAADWAAWHRREQSVPGKTFKLNDAPWRVPALCGTFDEEGMRQAFAQIVDGYRKIESQSS